MLDEIWTDLWKGHPFDEVPVTDEQVSRAVLDSWLAGVISNKGLLGDSAVEDLLNMSAEMEDPGDVGPLIERVVAAVRAN